jgi:MFS family permease
LIATSTIECTAKSATRKQYWGRKEDMTDAVSTRLPITGSARGWTAVAAGTIGLVFGPSTILLFLFGSFVAPLEQAFGWSRTAILFAVTIVSLMIMVVSPLQGFLIDRYGARPIVLASTVAFAAGLAAMSLIQGDIGFFYFMYALLPVLAIGLWPVSYLRVVSTWFDRRLGLAIGIVNGGIGLGAALLPLLVSYLVAEGGLPSAYLGLAVIIVLLTLPLNAWLLHEAPSIGGHQRASSVATSLADLRPVLKERDFTLLALAFLLLGFVNTGLVTNQIGLLIDGGATPGHAAIVQSVFGIAVLLGRFLTGVLLDHVDAKKLMSVVCTGGAVACGLYATGMTGATAFLCAILIGAIYGAEFDVLSYVVKRLFEIAIFGRVYGLIFAVFQLGAALGATLLPLSRAYWGGYGPGLIVYAATLLVSAALLLRLGSAVGTMDGQDGRT